MPLLVILKRFEVWLLAAVVVALLIFAFRPEAEFPDPVPVIGTAENTAAAIPPGGSEASVAGPPPAASEVITVRDVKVTGSKEGMIVELTLSGRSLTGEDITLDESTVTATTGEGEPVNRFFEPFREPAVLLAAEDSLATLKWWLEHPAGVIWLDLQGQRVKAELP